MNEVLHALRGHGLTAIRVGLEVSLHQPDSPGVSVITSGPLTVDAAHRVFRALDTVPDPVSEPYGDPAAQQADPTGRIQHLGIVLPLIVTEL